MKSIKIILFTITLLLSSFIINIGYAKLANKLEISGTLDAVVMETYDLYITNVSIVSSANTSNQSFTYSLPTNLSTTVKVDRNEGSIIYRVTVLNESDVTYWYDGFKYVSDVNDNSLINNGITIVTKDHAVDNTETFNASDWVPPHTERDFYVTYTFGNNALNKGFVTTYINFLFEIRIDSVHDGFLSVLNNPDSYSYISQKFDENYKATGKTVLGNLGDDEVIFDTLFGPNMTVVVDGVEKPVTVLIERNNMDNKSTGDSYSSPGGPSGCEYTIYITTDDITGSGSSTVYAITYRQGDDGQWHQLAQLYEGTANNIDYDTTTSTYEGAFDVSSWKATPKVYEIADGLSYKVNHKDGDQYDQISDLKSLLTVKDQDIFNEIDNSKFFKKVYDLLKNNKNSTAVEVVALRTAFENASDFYVSYNGGQEFKVNRSCTRAELICHIEEIQKALDYFNEVN